jgi:CRISPR-associated protein Cmr4
MQTRLFHLHAVSPLHVGVGQAIGVVDLPIMREKATHLPIVPGSSLKGVMRDEFADHPQQETLFGPPTADAEKKAFAGAVAFGDAHLLVLPVRSLVGICAFVTSPFLLNRYRTAAHRAGRGNLPAVPDVPTDQALVVPECQLLHDKKTLVLEDLDLPANPSAEAQTWAQALSDALQDADFAAHFRPRFVILPDEVLGFLADNGTEIRARIAIDDKTKTVRRGQLWYEENLPSETLLFGLLAFDRPRAPAGEERAEPRHDIDTAAAFTQHVGAARLIQIGGKATVGRGLVRFLLDGGAR